MIKDTVFLTFDQALEAIFHDFRQYAPQVRLFCEILNLISRGDIIAEKRIGKDGAWIGVPSRQNMRWMDGSELLGFVCETLSAADLTPELFAALCATVFQTPARLLTHAQTGRVGVEISTGMEDFNCRQCGQCCRSLNYQKEVTSKDIELWEKLGRTDILKHVGIFERNGEEPGYLIWVVPGTLQLADGCPFLKRKPAEDKWYCGIHDVKPAICRQYPASRKHAVMTGCPGFLDRGYVG